MIPRFTHVVIAVAFLLFFVSCSKPAKVLTPEQAITELLSYPLGKRDTKGDDDYIVVGRPTYKIRSAPTQAPSHYATVTGSMDSRGTRYKFTFTAFCKDGVWYFDPDGPMLLEQPYDSWSSSDPKYALHHCQMAALYRLGFKE